MEEEEAGEELLGERVPAGSLVVLRIEAAGRVGAAQRGQVRIGEFEGLEERSLEEPEGRSLPEERHRHRQREHLPQGRAGLGQQLG